MNLFTNNYFVLCGVFPSSLKGPTLTWWQQLPPPIINTFDTPIEHFGEQYVTCQSHHTTSVALINLHQVDDESLWDLMARFSWIAVKIRDLKPIVAFHAIIAALKLKALADSLCKNRPTGMDELRCRVIGFIQIEDLSNFCDKVRRGSQKKSNVSKEKIKPIKYKQRFH